MQASFFRLSGQVSFFIFMMCSFVWAEPIDERMKEALHQATQTAGSEAAVEQYLLDHCTKVSSPTDFARADPQAILGYAELIRQGKAKNLTTFMFKMGQCYPVPQVLNEAFYRVFSNAVDPIVRKKIFEDSAFTPSSVTTVPEKMGITVMRHFIREQASVNDLKNLFEELPAAKSIEDGLFYSDLFKRHWELTQDLDFQFNAVRRHLASHRNKDWIYLEPMDMLERVWGTSDRERRIQALKATLQLFPLFPKVDETKIIPNDVFTKDRVISGLESVTPRAPLFEDLIQVIQSSEDPAMSRLAVDLMLQIAPHDAIPLLIEKGIDPKGKVVRVRIAPFSQEELLEVGKRLSPMGALKDKFVEIEKWEKSKEEAESRQGYVGYAALLTDDELKIPDSVAEIAIEKIFSEMDKHRSPQSDELALSALATIASSSSFPDRRQAVLEKAKLRLKSEEGQKKALFFRLLYQLDKSAAEAFGTSQHRLNTLFDSAPDRKYTALRSFLKYGRKMKLEAIQSLIAEGHIPPFKELIANLQVGTEPIQLQARLELARFVKAPEFRAIVLEELRKKDIFFRLEYATPEQTEGFLKGARGIPFSDLAPLLIRKMTNRPQAKRKIIQFLNRLSPNPRKMAQTIVESAVKDLDAVTGSAGMSILWYADQMHRPATLDAVEKILSETLDTSATYPEIQQLKLKKKFLIAALGDIPQPRALDLIDKYGSQSDDVNLRTVADKAKEKVQLLIIPAPSIEGRDCSAKFWRHLGNYTR